MPVKTSGIYLLLSDKSDKVYVGSSVNIEGRFREHIRELSQGKHHNYKLQQHFDKHQPQLSLYILVECTVEEMPELELEYIHLYQSVMFGFNVSYDTRRNKPRKKKRKKMTHEQYLIAREEYFRKPAG